MTRDHELRFAKTPQEYKAAWDWHIGQLQLLALKANVTFEHWMDVKKELDSWVGCVMAKELVFIDDVDDE